MQSKSSKVNYHKMDHQQHHMVGRPDMEAHADPDPVAYENDVYQKGLSYTKPAFTFKPLEWEELASARMSAESKGYVVGNAGTGETARKNREAFYRWSIVPRRLVDTQGKFPDLSTAVLGQSKILFPIAFSCWCSANIQS